MIVNLTEAVSVEDLLNSRGLYADYIITESYLILNSVC